MKFIYFGSSLFAHTIINDLYSQNIVPSLVVSQPDRPKSRGLKFFPTEVSLFAAENKIPLIKPSSLKKTETIQQLKQEEADLFIVADYGKFLPLEVISLPRLFCLGIHPSMLPYYRGAAPIARAIMDGVQETGISIFKVNSNIDGGDILVQRRIVIDDSDTVVSLTRRLAHESSVFLIEAMENIQNNKYGFLVQNEKEGSFAAKLQKQEGKVNWQKDAISIWNLIRATIAWPTAYTFYNGQMIKIIEASVIADDERGVPSSIVKIDKEGIYVATGKGILQVKKVKPQARNEMSAYAFVCGHDIKVGDCFDK